MPLDQLYQDAILAHNRNPVGFGEVPGATHRARGRDALCGDDLGIELKLRHGRVAACGFTGAACTVTLASVSMLMAWLPGRDIAEIPAAYARFRQRLADPGAPDDPLLGEINQLKAVAHFPARVKNALLPWRTVLAALCL